MVRQRQPFVYHSIFHEVFPELRGKLTGAHVLYCPFHPDSGTRSFSVDLDKGVFYCHGGCTDPKGGDHITFYAKQHRISRTEALLKVVQLQRRAMFDRERAQARERFDMFARWANRYYTTLRRALEAEIVATVRGTAMICACLDECECDVDVSERLDWALLSDHYKNLGDVDYVLETLDELRDVERRDTRHSAALVSAIKQRALALYDHHSREGDWDQQTYDIECKIVALLARESQLKKESQWIKTTNARPDLPSTTIPRTPV